MAIRRITISVPEEVAGRIKRAAGKQPVSSWVTTPSSNGSGAIAPWSSSLVVS